MSARDGLDDQPLDTGYETIIVSACLVSIGIAALYWLLRVGFDNPLSAPASAAALGLFVHTFPLSARRMLLASRLKHNRDAWWASHCFLWLAALVVTGVLGRLAPLAPVPLFPVLAIAGVISFALIFARWIRTGPFWRSCVIVLGCVVFALWISGVEWGRIYKNPLYLENFILNGTVHHDTLDIMALGNMLRTYGIASPGLDGLTYVPWHWGSVWFVAQCANLLRANMVTAYQLIYPVVAIPLFFGAPLAFAVALRKRRGGPHAAADLRADSRIWFVFLAACIGFLPVSALDAMGVWTSNLVISDSYTFGVPCALLLLVTVIAAWDSSRAATESLRRFDSASLFIVFGIPAGLVALGYLKSSLMILGYLLGAYAFVRLELYKRRRYIVAFILTTISVYLTYHRVVLPAHNEGIAPFDFLRAFVPRAWWLFFPFVHLFWTILFTVLRLRAERVSTIGNLKEAFAERRILDVEAAAVVALAGLAPGLLIHIDGGSAFYFSDVQRWLSLGFLMSWMPVILRSPAMANAVESDSPDGAIRSRVDKIRLRRVVIAFLFVPVVGSMVANMTVWPLEMLRYNARTRHALYPANVASAIPSGLHGLPHLANAELLRNGLRRAPNFAVAEGLLQVARLPLQERRQTALFIPQTETRYWTSLTRQGACTFQPYVAPALASVAMIDGMPAYGCTLSKYYGLGSFPRRARPQTDSDRAPQTLCSRARQRGFSRVLVLSFADSESGRPTIDCQHILSDNQSR